jgi:Flp pilus assembly secretin CpaC
LAAADFLTAAAFFAVADSAVDFVVDAFVVAGFLTVLSAPSAEVVASSAASADFVLAAA